jgi:hypothetical protein
MNISKKFPEFRVQDELPALWPITFGSEIEF